MNRIIWLSFAILLAACGACGANQYPDAVPTMLDPAVVKLASVVEGEVQGYCTGWKISPTHMMTAGHCCDEGTTFLMEGPHAIPGETAKVSYDDDEHDVCVLKGKMMGTPIKIAPRDPMLGAAVWTAGFPKTHYLISSGYWSGRENDNQGRVSVAVWGGASGSPIMDSRGDAVCMLVAYYPPMANFALCTPVEWLRIAAELGTK